MRAARPGKAVGRMGWRPQQREGPNPSVWAAAHAPGVRAFGCNPDQKKPGNWAGLERLTRPAQGGDTGGAGHQVGL